MTGRVRRDGATARKNFLGKGARSGSETARRSVVLAAAGIATPIGRFDATDGNIVFPWLDGISGRRHLASETAAGRGHPVLVAAITVLARLHRADAPALRLPPFDPWKRISPRLAALPRDVEATDFHAARAAVGAALDAAAGHDEPGLGLIHGDFHIGQLIFPTAGSAPWLLDLEDLAVGPAEADLGNFIAHIVTSEDLYDGALVDGFRRFADSLRAAYEAETGITLAANRIDAYGAAALLRRGLKLREHDRQPPPTEIARAAVVVAGE